MVRRWKDVVYLHFILRNRIENELEVVAISSVQFSSYQRFNVQCAMCNAFCMWCIDVLTQNTMESALSTNV